MKDCTTCKYGFVDEQLGFPMCHHPSRFSEDCVDFNMHEEKEEPEKATGIEEKKLPEGLEEAKEAYCNEHNDDCFDATGDTCPHIRKAFIAGAEWMKAKMMEEAEECDLYYDGDFLAIDLNMAELGYSEKDKLKIIIVKEDKR